MDLSSMREEGMTKICSCLKLLVEETKHNVSMIITIIIIE